MKRGMRIFFGGRRPQSAFGIESNLNRLADIRIGRDQLHLEAFGDFEGLEFLFGRPGGGGRDMRVLLGIQLKSANGHNNKR